MADVQTHEQDPAQPPSSDATVVSSTQKQSQPAIQTIEDADHGGNDQSVTRRTDQGHNPEAAIQTPVSAIEQTFAQALEHYQRQLDQEFDAFESDLEQRPRDEDLVQLDWDELEQQYEEEAGKKVAEEHDIMREFDARFKQFMLWMQVSHERETHRAIKRLKTQSSFVQTSESKLAEKDEHYGKVMVAFQNAMQLLTLPS